MAAAAHVELPLAAPVIAAGIRTATVWTVGAATLATPVGQPCLGNYIFAGLQTRNFAMLLVGVVAAAALAIILDALLGAAEHALAGRAKRRALVPAAVLRRRSSIVVVACCRGSRPTATPRARPAAAERRTPRPITHVRIGGKTFTEQYILVELLRQRLAAAGIAVDVAQSLGSTVVFDALAPRRHRCLRRLLGHAVDERDEARAGAPRWQVLAEIEALARDATTGSAASGRSASRTRTRSRCGATPPSGSACTRSPISRAHAGALAIGGDYEFFGRAEWAAVQRAYGLRFARTASFDPSLLYEAVARGEVDVISAFSSDGRIAALRSGRARRPARRAPALRRDDPARPPRRGDPRIACALASLHVDVDEMRQANAMVDRDGKPARDAAAWLLDRQPAPACETR